MSTTISPIYFLPAGAGVGSVSPTVTGTTWVVGTKAVDIYGQGNVFRSPAWPTVPMLQDGTVERNAYYHFSVMPDSDSPTFVYGER